MTAVDRCAPSPDTVAAARVAVVAHRRKTLDGGLAELRTRLAGAGVADPGWYEVKKSRQAPKRAKAAVKAGAELLLVWGGDGTVQRCIDAVAGTGVTVGIIPAGTANLLATNLGIPHDLAQALDVALGGRNRRLDLGRVNGEHFAVMAGAGFDATMIDKADSKRKSRLGVMAYVQGGMAALRSGTENVHVTVDGVTLFEGRAGCVLVGNVPTAAGGLRVFRDAKPDDGVLDFGVATAGSAGQWLRVLSRVALRHAERSPLVHITQGTAADVRFAAPVVYQLDGGTRKATDRLRFEIVPGALEVRVPR